MASGPARVPRRPDEKEPIVHHDHMSAMTEATALTRAGRLDEATAVIQRALSGRSAQPEGTVPGEVPRADRRADDEQSRHPGSGRRTRGSLRGLGSRLRERLGRAVGTAPSRPRPPGVETSPDEVTPVRPGETSVHVHRSPAGDRPYILYVPTTGTGRRPLVVMLHGGTQTAEEFAAATRMSALAQEHGFLVAYPEQVTSANAMRYWNWFQPADQQRDAGEPAIIAGIIAEIAAAHAVDPDRVYIAGLSAGAAMAAVVAAAYPDVIAAVGVHSGLPRGCAHDVASGFAAMRQAPRAAPLGRPVPAIAFHGDADSTVAPDNATRVVEQFTGGPVSGETLVERGSGRPATRTVVRRGGAVVGERWIVHGSGHAWSGGLAGASYTDPDGPDASAEMVRFFAEHPRHG
jgi:poly(hydroxyalkanoate) depolymerase family esterase